MPPKCELATAQNVKDTQPGLKQKHMCILGFKVFPSMPRFDKATVSKPLRFSIISIQISAAESHPRVVYSVEHNMTNAPSVGESLLSQLCLMARKINPQTFLLSARKYINILHTPMYNTPVNPTLA